jgi:hypothetical protein
MQILYNGLTEILGGLLYTYLHALSEAGEVGGYLMAACHSYL